MKRWIRRIIILVLAIAITYQFICINKLQNEVTGFMTRVKDGGIDNGWKIS